MDILIYTLIFFAIVVVYFAFIGIHMVNKKK